MLKKLFLYTMALIFLSMSTTLFAADFDSHYSSIAENNCRTLESDNHSSTQRCAHFGGFSVIVTDFDARQDIILQHEKSGKRFPLNLPQTVSSAFSALGDKIEWRYKKGKPTELAGMIVRFNVSENPDKPHKTTSYLVVSKVTDDQVCVVGKISAQTGNTQNQRARTMVEKASTMSCVDDSLNTEKTKTPSPVNTGADSDSDSTVALSRATYQCDGKIAFEVVFEVGKVRYIMLDETLVLREEVSESGSRYSDGETILWLQGNEAMVEINGVSPFSSCETLKRKDPIRK